MYMISASDVKTLREKTGAGMMDCKNALVETDGCIDDAVVALREKGLASAAKKAGRIAAEGVVESYIHMGGKIGVLVEVNCETDFVAKTPAFVDFVKDVAMQIAAAKPTFLSSDEVPADEIEKEKEILRAQALNEGKPEKIVDKMVEGRIKKYFKEVCLLEQPFVKDPDKTVATLVMEKTAEIGEKIDIRRFTRYEMGEGLEKRQDDFVDEVMKQTSK
ncbi:MAG: translation elongation factor Ts [Clostridia bacterium]|nr:translation elongation factor Ts [Clostridia bacterium]